MMSRVPGPVANIDHDWVEDFVARWLASWNAHDAERVLDLLAEDVAFDDPARPETMHGHGEVRDFLGFLWRAFPDFTVEAVGGPLVGTDGPRAAFWWRCRMTNTGPIDPPGLPPTGRAVAYEGADFHQYAEGRVSRLWVLYDMRDVFRQLGLDG